MTVENTVNSLSFQEVLGASAYSRRGDRENLEQSAEGASKARCFGEQQIEGVNVVRLVVRDVTESRNFLVRRFDRSS